MNKNMKGFTFVELIVAVTIFAIIASSVYAVFGTGLRVWRKMNPVVENNQSARAFFFTIDRDLKNMVAYQIDGVNFKGGPGRVAFMTLVEVSGTDVPLHSELAQVVYSLDKDTRTIKRLVATREKGLDEAKAKTEVMLTGVDEKAFGFEYGYKASFSGAGSRYDWKDKWEEEAKIPRGVRIKLKGFVKMVFIPTGMLGVQK